MDSSNPKQSSSSFAKAASLDVSRLDKTHALTNKTTDNILMGGLCHEDQLYLNALMDDDSSDGGDGDKDMTHQSSAWSPMIQSPMMTNKRIKKLRPAYAVTLSLEDISYIRPSWGISKGMKTIKKKDPKKVVAEKQQQQQQQGKKEDTGPKSHDTSFRWFLVILTLVVLVLTVPTYLYNQKKEFDKSRANRLFVDPGAKTLSIYKASGESVEPILKVHLGTGIPRDLKPDQCTCAIYTAESKRYTPNLDQKDQQNCFACLDWAYRANLRVHTEKRVSDKNSFCYDIKWTSYDTLQTPLVDCFEVKDEQWFGLGDIQWPLWQLNKHQFDETLLVSNLTAEFSKQSELIDNLQHASSHLALGSYVNFSLFSTSGIFIGKIRTDFQVSLKISQDPKLGGKRICLSASCTDKCTQSWSRLDHLEQFKYANNILEYKICSAENLKSLITRQFSDRVRSPPIDATESKMSKSREVIAEVSGGNASMSAKLIEREANVSQTQSIVSGQLTSITKSASVDATNEKETVNQEREYVEGIGLIERTIFATSPEFLPVLDGQTLRHLVDEIVKLDLKASPILLIDSRWETHVGSLELNMALFPKARLLFEILHNKGFKIVLTIKPYMDTTIGATSVNQLFDTGRLYSANFRKDTHVWPSFGTSYNKATRETHGGTVIRRKSLFTYANESIETGFKDSVRIPYICRCKESLEGYCALIDLTRAKNRAWMIDNIMQSTLLTKEADGVQIGGAHPNSFYWDDHYRDGVSQMARTLMLKEKVYTIAQWTGDFGYIQLAPRHFSWDGLRSILGSTWNLGIIGFSLVHPGSVWGDLRSTNMTDETSRLSDRINIIYGGDHMQSSAKSDEELAIRWLQVSVFLPMLQFNNIAPIKRYGLQEMVQSLTRIRKLHVVPEIKKHLPFTPLIAQSITKTNTSSSPALLPLIRPVWLNQEAGDVIVGEQFTIGPDLLVAPILSEGVRQRDIYLPNGFWRDELRQINIRGGKWLRNYPVELNEIAWFTRSKR